MSSPSRRRPLRASLLASSLWVAGLALATLDVAAQPPEPPPLAADDRAAIVDGVAAAFRDVYVFPEVAAKMEEHVRARLAAGGYDALATVPELCDALTADLRSISHDLHVGVRWDPEAGGPEPTAEEQAARRARNAERQRRDNYCFRDVERLAGNVGYLRLDCFAPAELGGATAVAAMRFLAGSDALIFDLRQNGGGSPSMIQLLTSYLVAEPTHLNSFYVRRDGSTQQFWTQAHVEGPRFVDVPVYVLTSGRTFSAAEEFTYNLKSLGRGTIVGETTGGGAHPVDGIPVAGHPVVAIVPFGRAVNPITGTNWEGTGVEPHVAVPAGDALAVAHEKALTELESRAIDPELRRAYAWQRDGLAARRAVAPLDPARLADYPATYGPRIVELDGDVLTYRRGDGPRHVLRSYGDDRFLVGELETFRIRFERDAAGKVVRLVGIYDDGREEPSARE